MNETSEELGRIEIAPEVIEIIAGIAASEVEGVAGMRSSFATGMAEKLGKKNLAKGVKADISQTGIVIDIYCLMNFGVSMPNVSFKLQEVVRQALKTMTGLEVNEVNVHVIGVHFEQIKHEEQEIN